MDGEQIQSKAGTDGTAERPKTDPNAATLPTHDEAVRAEFERLRQHLGFDEAALIEGRYRIERSLGRGAMGQVYLARDVRLDRAVALKLVRSRPDISTATLQSRLRREAKALARVDHPNVVGIHDVGTHGGRAYLTMQYIAGETLRDWQTEPGRTHIERVRAYTQAARGLAAAHACAVVHRDFKPDNVIVGEDGLVRVLDFGLAAALRTAESEGTLDDAPPSVEPDAASSRTTKIGALLGTLPYMAPEQLAGRRATALSDQFGFCVAMWEGLAGVRPFSGRTVDALSAALESGPIGGDALPRPLRAVLTRGVAARPDERWPDMHAIIDALERFAHRPRRTALALGAIAAVLAGGIAGIVLAREASPTGRSHEVPPANAAGRRTPAANPTDTPADIQTDIHGFRPAVPDPARPYRLETAFLGDAMCLAVEPEAEGHNARMIACSRRSATWRFSPIDVDGERLYVIRSDEFDDAWCLEGSSPGAAARGGAASIEPCTLTHNQTWRLVPDGPWFRLQTLFHGPDLCLEGNSPESPVHDGDAFLSICQDVSGQAWALVELDDPGGLSR